VAHHFIGNSGISLADHFVMKRNVDVIFVAAGGWGWPTMLEAASLGAYVIGVDSDVYSSVFEVSESCNSTCSNIVRSKLLTSVIKNVDVGVYNAIKNDLEIGFAGGTS
jgi:basic membrane lipoprotein Med (substrate-binding protein (PBP1-ABC) superfamily)